MRPIKRSVYRHELLLRQLRQLDILKSEQEHCKRDDTSDVTLTVTEMRSELEQKGVNFADCVFTGADLDALIKMLYNYRDRIAVNLTDLEVCDILQCEIDTGDALPSTKSMFSILT
jgi:hypothetical protein